MNTNIIRTQDQCYISKNVKLGSDTNPIRVGSGYRFQKVRSLVDLNNNGPLHFVPTNDDKNDIIISFPEIFTQYPNLSDYVYLTEITKGNVNNSLPLYKINGKSFGEHDFYLCGTSKDGNICLQPEYLSFYYTNIFRGRIFVPEAINDFIPRYPFNGKISTGMLTQLSINTSDSKLSIIPYQAGRGIPQYDPTKEYFSGDAYTLGNDIYYPNTTIPILPSLSMGSVPGNNDACLGVVVSTESKNDSDKVYKYTRDDNTTLLRYPWEPWYNHPSAFTVESQTFGNEFVSPINSGGHYYAPWPEYYSFSGNNNDAVPVCSDGITSLIIGAATNIGAMAYYTPDVAEDDDPINNPNYVSVSIVPLFQGEQVKIGNYAYANAMGTVITPKPVGTDYGPVPSYADASGLREFYRGPEPGNIQRDGRRDNPYYNYFDATYGAVGWTSTPQFKLNFIPDEGVQIIETRNGTTLPYLNQSNQGSCIVQAVTTTNTLSSGGSGRMELISNPDYTSSDFENNGYNSGKFERLTKIPGSPGRSLSIGKTTETITGTGVWTYTGTILDFDQTDFVCGYGYSTGLYNTTNATNESESGLTVDVTAVNSDGSITTAVLNSQGTTSDGSVLTIVTGINWGPTLKILDSASVLYDAGNITLNVNGSNYESSTYEKCFNVSANNLLVSATVENNVQFPDVDFNVRVTEIQSLFSYVTSVSVFGVTDITRYPLGTRVRMISTQSNPDNWAVFEVDSNDGITMTLALTSSRGGRNVYPLGTFVYTTEIVDYPHPSARITTDNGGVDTVNMIEIPQRNREDDIILIPQKGSDKNFLFQLKNNVNRIQTFSSLRLKGGAGYEFNYGGSLGQDTIDGTIFNPGKIDSTADVTIGPTDLNQGIGRLLQASQDYNVNSTYTGKFGNIQTIVQNRIGSRFNSYVSRATATFIQKVRYFIQEPGSGYTVGEYNVSGGSGTNMVVYVLKVNDTGGILKVRTKNIGEEYEYNDIITLLGGNNDTVIKLKIPQSRELILGEELNFFTSTEQIIPLLLFTPEIVNPGTGYFPGTTSTLCPVYENASSIPFYLGVAINEVGPNGEIRDIELEIPAFDIVDQTAMYQIDYNLIVRGGNDNGIIKLRKPTKAKLMEFTDGGTNYSTATSVDTFNLSQNNLAVLCNNPAGQCIATNYTVTDQGESFWDLSRYQVGDVLQLNQNGNVSATVEITAITFNSITFNQLTNGVGYINTPGQSLIPTINTSVANTTVDIIANDGGNITSSTINTLGPRTRYNDVLIITQNGSDDNSVIQIASERDVPAPWQPFENGRAATAVEWNEYKEVLTSSVNLLDSQVLVDFKKNYPNYFNNSWYYYGDPDNKDPHTTGLELNGS